MRRIRRARFVAIYLPMINELDTSPLITLLLRAGKRLFAPCVDLGGNMYLVPLTRSRRRRRDALGMQVPVATRHRRSARRFDVIILPLVGFDADGHRLGMGAGYYDRLLNFRRVGAHPWLIGYAYPQQETARLPADPWDIKLDAVALSSGLRTLTQVR